MKQLLILALVLITFPAFSQLGVNVRYQRIDSELWKKWTNEENLFDNSYEIGVDYWFRLKNYRVEFMPELYAATSNTKTILEAYNFNTVGLAVNTNFYIFDLVGDCNCPTFSKDGNLFTKGFYLSVAPLVEYQSKVIITDTELKERDNATGYGASIGAGLDIGVTDLITISPYVRYKFLPNTSWDNLALRHAQAGSELTITNLSYFQFGLRLGFRPDYVREQNKYRFR